MSNPNETTLLVAIVGLVGTLLGGALAIFGNMFTYYISHKTDKIKLRAKKLEEIYDLSIDIKNILELELADKKIIQILNPTELTISYGKSFRFEIRNKLEIMVKISTLFYEKDIFQEVLEFKKSILSIMPLIDRINSIDTADVARNLNDSNFTDFLKKVYFQIEEVHTKLCIALGLANIKHPDEIFF